MCSRIFIYAEMAEWSSVEHNNARALKACVLRDSWVRIPLSAFRLFVRKIDFDEYVFRNFESHELSHGSVVGIQINQAPVDTELPSIKSASAVSRRGLSSGNFEFFRRKWLWTSCFDTCTIGNVFNLLANYL